MDSWSKASADALPPNALSAERPHVWRLAFDVASSRLESLEQTLDADERARASRFHFDRHRNEFVACRGMLRVLLAAYTGAPPALIRFGYSAAGKPYVTSPASDVRFNISHSGRFALLAFAIGREIGVDVEYRRELDDLLALASTSFSQREYAVLASLPDADRRSGFFSCWSRKEAFIKATGVGLSHLADFDVSLHPEPPRLERVAAPFTGQWSIYDLPPIDDHAGALCVEGAAFDIECFDLAFT